MDQLLEFLHSEHDDYLLDSDLHMLQAWLVVATSSKVYKVYNMLFHKYGGEKFSITNRMSHFLCLSQPRPLKNWLMKTWYISKELVLFYVVLLIISLLIRWYQFIIL